MELSTPRTVNPICFGGREEVNKVSVEVRHAERYVRGESRVIETPGKMEKVRFDSVPIVVYEGVDIEYEERDGKAFWHILDSGKDMESVHETLYAAKQFIDKKLSKPSLLRLNIPVLFGRWGDWKKGIVTSVCFSRYAPKSIWIKDSQGKRHSVYQDETVLDTKENVAILKELKAVREEEKKSGKAFREKIQRLEKSLVHFTYDDAKKAKEG